MQLTTTMDYALRIVNYLANKGKMASTNELSKELTIPNSYIPKIIKGLKNNHLIAATEGMKGGYSLIKSPPDITLYDVISSTQSTMSNKCLDGSEKSSDLIHSDTEFDTDSIRKMLNSLENDYIDKLKNLTISDFIEDNGNLEYLENSKKNDRYLLMKVALNNNNCIEIISTNNDNLEKNNNLTNVSFNDFIKIYVENYVFNQDAKKVEEFLGNTIESINAKKCSDMSITYRGAEYKKIGSIQVTMLLNRHYDLKKNVLFFTFSNAKQNSINFSNNSYYLAELKKHDNQNLEIFWRVIALLEAVLDHNNIIKLDHKHDISFYTEQIYLQLQKDYPEYHITNEEIKNISRLAPIHDIGKIGIPIEILNKKGKLTKQEMDIVKEHPVIGSKIILKFPLNDLVNSILDYAYNICLYHHERYDGNGYPKQLKGDGIPLCAQVVGLVDAYDALINDRPYKRALSHADAVRMIVSGECGSFSNKLLVSFLEVSMKDNWQNFVREIKIQK